MSSKDTFSTPQEEIEHWKNLAGNYKLKCEETRLELDEYQESSRELEAELETQIVQLEGKNKELTATNSRLQADCDQYKEKLEKSREESLHQITSLRDELGQVRSIKDELLKYIRELEQANDDLERAKRATVVSLDDFEVRLNMALERNAFLESELDEKEALKVCVQRLKDETRDLKQDLTVTKSESLDNLKSPAIAAATGSATSATKSTTGKPKPPLALSSLALGSSVGSSGTMERKLCGGTTPTTPLGTPLKGFQSLNLNGGQSPLTPSARISALNIVGDLLRKVGALETKLASCRNFTKDMPIESSSTPASVASARAALAAKTSPLNSPS